jgi:hypothetical protein
VAGRPGRIRGELMANPFFGRVGDMIASGNNYDKSTG